MSAPDPGDPAALPGDAAGAGGVAAQRAASSRPASSGPAFAQPPPGPAPGPASPTSDAGASVNADNPWLGLASFTEATRGYFFGREQEITELERRVQRKLLTVLFGKSGLGKTSILQAGLVPGLRARGYFPVYLRIDYGHDSPEASEQIKQAINKAAAGRAGEAALQAVPGQGAAAQGAEQGPAAEGAAQGSNGQAAAGQGAVGQGRLGHGAAAPAIDPEESIWEFLHHREVLQASGAAPGDVSAETRTVKSAAIPIPLLIFDQFEELFTLAQSDEFGRARAARFVEELADLVENRPPKALEARLETDDSLSERFDFSRSDYRVVISLREDYLAPLESLKRQMPSLSQNRLRLAPMTGDQALEAVLEPGNRLRPGKPLVTEEVAEAIVRFVAGGAELANAEVEPSLLSLICRELNEQRLAQHHSEISLGLLAGSRESILGSFYERALADQPPAVRRVIEDELLTESGYRENLAEESLLRRLQAAGAAPDALAKLVNRRLLRIEERLDVRRVELTHDVLTGVVKASRDARHEREAREATERMLAEQRAREEAARRSLRRVRAVAAGCSLLAALAIIAAVVAFVNVRRARRAQLLAQQTRAISEQARQQAEGLLGFLTDDFVRELESFGRYQTIAELSQREIDYFRHLPAQLRDPQTVRSGALALVNHAYALRFLGDYGTLVQNATEAISLLEQLRRDGDRSDSTAVVLARADTQRGRGLTTERNPQGPIDLGRAADLLRPMIERAGAPVEARRAYVYTLTWIGYWELNSNRSEDAARTEREAMRIATAPGARSGVDFDMDALYAMAGAWRAGALVQLGRNEEARRVGEDALGIADRVLAQRPQYVEVLHPKQLIEHSLAELAEQDLAPAEALSFATPGEQASFTLARLDPENLIYLMNLLDADGEVGEEMWSLGRTREAIAYERKAIAEIPQPGTLDAGRLAGLTRLMAFVAYRQAQLGDLTGATRTAAAAEAFLSPSVLRRLGPSGRAMEPLINAARAYPAALVAYGHGDLATARRSARDALAKLKSQADGASGATLYLVYRLSDIEGRAEYGLGDFAAAAQAERAALRACKASVDTAEVASQREVGHVSTWLSMALAREGKRAEAAQAIGPAVTMYRGLEKRSHGDQWLPLELAGALYAQALTDEPHRATLLREAAERVDHLIPSIATLHYTRQWRARIEAAQRGSGGEAGQ